MRQFNIYPNPFIQKLSVEITSDENETAIVSLLSESGNILRMFSWPLKPGVNKTSLDGLGSLPAETYDVSIKEISGKVIYLLAVSKEEDKA